MAKRIDVAGPVGAEISGVLRDLIGDAHDALEQDGDIREAVHEARKNFKAMRSHLRLLKPAIGDDYDTLDETAGSLARRLSDARDGQALHDAIDLVQRRLNGRSAGAVRLMRAGADSEFRNAAGEDEIRAAAAEVAGATEGCIRIIETRVLDDEPSMYLDGLRSTYRAARRKFRHALETGLPDDLHTARKRIINLRYQFDLLRDIRPKPMRRRVRHLQELREALGQHNDLVLLQSRLEQPTSESWRLNDSTEVIDAITLMRAEYVRQAAALGKPFFRETPKSKVGKLAAWWEEARQADKPYRQTKSPPA